MDSRAEQTHGAPTDRSPWAPLLRWTAAMTDLPVPTPAAPHSTARPSSPLSRRRMMTWTGAALAAASLPPGTAHAQSWLEQGRKLLDGLSGGNGKSALSVAEIAAGLRDALKVGTGRVVGTLGVEDGFNLNPDVHIPLPGALKDVQQALSVVGLSGMTDELELRLNRAAETAMPRGKAMFWDAIRAMTLDDVMGIYEGPKDSATRYFQGRMTPDLVREFSPIVQDSLSDVGAVQAYDRVMGRYKAIPFVPDAKADLTDYTVEKGLDGLFLLLGHEEAAIRENPAARTTDLLKRVFGA